MDDEKKEKLEKELQFLKDSLSSGIISQEEFNRGESRIQNQLNAPDEEVAEEVSEEKEAEVTSEEKIEKPEEPVSVEPETSASDVVEEVSQQVEAEKAVEDASVEPTEVEEESTQRVEEDVPVEETSEKEPEDIQAESEEVSKPSAEEIVAEVVEEPAKEQEVEEPVKEETSEVSEELAQEVVEDTPTEVKAEVDTEKVEDSVKEGEDASAEVKAGEEDVPISEQRKTEPVYDAQEESGRSSLGMYLIVLIIIAGGLFFLLKGNPFGESAGLKDQPIDLLTPSPITELACYRDGDCSEERMIGKCENAGTEGASCTFTKDAEVHLSIIDDASCSLCDSTRMEHTLREVFPNLVVERISYQSDEGMDIALRQEIPLLPAYFISSGVENAAHFGLFARALVEAEGGYFVGPKASGASYFIGKEESPQTLTVFVTSDVRDRTLNNIQPVLDLFGEDITFTERGKGSSVLAAQFAVSTYPTFIVNNKIRFSGIHSPEKIKENYCLLNSLTGCSTALTSQIS